MFLVQQSYGVGIESSVLKKRVHINYRETIVICGIINSSLRTSRFYFSCF